MEFIGCTGAGKSSLIEGFLQTRHAQERTVLSSHEYVLRRVGLGKIAGGLLGSLVVQILAAVTCAATLRRNRGFFVHALRVITRLPVEVRGWERLKLARLVLKNVGVYEIVRRKCPSDWVVLADEGTLHIAHSLFVHVSTPPDFEELAQFAQLVPLPDAAVYVTACERLLTERTLRRGHKRIRTMTPPDVQLFVHRAVRVFEELANHPRVKDRLVIMEHREENTILCATPRDPKLAVLLKVMAAGTEPGFGTAPSSRMIPCTSPGSPPPCG